MLKPLPANAWNVEAAAHLLNRAAFGGTPEEVKALHGKGMVGAVEFLLRGQEDSDLFAFPDWLNPRDFVALRQERRAMDEEEKRRSQVVERRNEAQALQYVRYRWIDRMHASLHPVREKLTLFWHGHFATSMQKVRSAYLMAAQIETFRAKGMGKFGELTKAVSKDPAMMEYLDVRQNKLKKPNENFARELMELFTLGEGAYSEADIRESARAFTGYTINPRDQSFYFAPKLHDAGPKTFMGRTGNFTGDDIIDIILARPECARFISGKIWRFYGSDRPNPAFEERIAVVFRNSGYDMTTLLRYLFTSEAFYAQEVIRSQIKSPVQWMVQTARSLGTQLPDIRQINSTMSQLGQELLAPPNVKGWDGGRSWISSATLLARYNASRVFVEPGVKPDFAKLAPPVLRESRDGLIAELAFRLYGAPAAPRVQEQASSLLAGRRVDDAAVRDLLLLMMSTPEFQLT